MSVSPVILLVVGDEQDNSHALQHWLEHQGYVVHSEKQPAQAIDVISRRMADLVLLNGELSNERGLDICRFVKGNDALGFIPVIIMVAPESPRIEPAFGAGADDVLIQPVRQSEMLTRINVLLRVKRRYDAIWQQNQALTYKLAKQNQELELALKAQNELSVLKDSIVRNVSHELRTPLLQVKSAVAMLAEDARAASPTGASVLADHATAATARLESVVQNITQLAAVLNLKTEPFRLADAVNLAKRQLGRQWASSGGVDRIKVTVDNAPLVLGDRGGVAQVLQQLLDNAIKFSPNGGPVEVSAARQGATVCVTVKDYGIGIAEDQLGQIFQAFYQVDSSPTRSFGGTGVGLTIVKLLLDQMGINVQVESKPGAGSTFSFALPISPLDIT